MPYSIKDTKIPGPKRYLIVKKGTNTTVAHAATKRNARLYVAYATKHHKRN